MSFATSIQGMLSAMRPYRGVFEAGVAFEAEANDALDDAAPSTLDIGSITARQELNSALVSTKGRLAFVEQLAAACRPWWRKAMQDLGYAYTTDAAARDRIVEAAYSAGMFVARRRVNYGSDPADNVVGIHRRLTENHLGQVIESGMHNLPEGIKITVENTESNGSADGVTVVRYDGGGTDGQTHFNQRGFQPLSGIQLLGPNNGGLANNPTLGGVAAPADGDSIPDTPGSISGWVQTRTGPVTVKARTSLKWKSQSYGVGVGGDTASLKLEQSLEDWDLTDSPVAYMMPVLQSGSGLNVEITSVMGSQSDTWDETDLVNGSWVSLICTLDKRLHPRNFDTTASKFSVTVALQPGSTGEAILGGVFAARMFQLQPGGEWHVAWDREAEPVLGAVVSFGPDRHTAVSPVADLWCRLGERDLSLPTAAAGNVAATATINAVALADLVPANDYFTITDPYGETWGFWFAGGRIQCAAKADLADQDYIIFTLADAGTVAFWFQTDGNDTEPAGAAAADVSIEVDVQAATTAASVAAILEPLLEANVPGLTFADVGGGLIAVVVDAPGSGVALAEFVTDASFTVALSDTAPAGAAAADNVVPVSIATGTSSTHVADAIEAAIDAYLAGMLSSDNVGAAVTVTVSDAGALGNDWVVAETVTNAGFTVVAFAGGIDVGILLELPT